MLPRKKKKKKKSEYDHKNILPFSLLLRGEGGPCAAAVCVTELGGRGGSLISSPALKSEVHLESGALGGCPVWTAALAVLESPWSVS